MLEFPDGLIVPAAIFSLVERGVKRGTLLRFQLAIAGIPFQLHFTENTALPLSASLQHFTFTDYPGPRRPTIVEIIDDDPEGHTAEQYLKKRNASITMKTCGDHLLFSYFTGQFLADKRFQHVRLWSPYEREMSIDRDGYANYNGDPTLRLIVWGRASIENIAYLHGALVALENRYLLFVGKSGSGKTTLSKLACARGATCLTEEDPFVSCHHGQIVAHASPWPGSMGPAAPQEGSLAAIFFLKHATQNQVRQLSLQEACRRLLKNTRPFNWLPETLPGTIGLLDHVAASTPAYEFGFVPDSSAIDAILASL